MSTLYLYIGTPFVKRPNEVVDGSIVNTTATFLSELTEDDTDYSEFAGVTVRNNEPFDTVTGAQIRLQSEGYALARVYGPIASGDSIGIKWDGDIMIVDALAGTPDIALGIAKQAISTAAVQLIRVFFGGAGGGGGEDCPYG